MPEALPSPAAQRPPWPRKKLVFSEEVHGMKEVVRRHGLRTVCEDAKCPNLSECFSHREATFIVMGDRCTRRCSFCAIPTGRPAPLDPGEPRRLAEAIAEIGFHHVVVTGVARDDLADAGAAHYAACVRQIRLLNPTTTVEVLTSDFKGEQAPLEVVAAEDLQVFNHNVETVPRLHREVRPQARYERSLDVLARFKRLRPDVFTKSGLMLGLGETDDEVEGVLRDLRLHEVDVVTIGQYMQPMLQNSGVQRFATLERFEQFERLGKALGFRLTLSGPYVRSSFAAGDAAALLKRVAEPGVHP
jgi:lipoic acid synthetase